MKRQRSRIGGIDIDLTNDSWLMRFLRSSNQISIEHRRHPSPSLVWRYNDAIYIYEGLITLLEPTEVRIGIGFGGWCLTGLSAHCAARSPSLIWQHFGSKCCQLCRFYRFYRLISTSPSITYGLNHIMAWKSSSVRSRSGPPIKPTT
jgi:hypothetical protein